MPNDEHTRAGAAWVGCMAARVAGTSAGARVTNVQDANFDDPASTPKIRSEAPAQTISNDEEPMIRLQLITARRANDE